MLSALALLLAGCAEPAPADTASPASCETGETYTWVMTAMRYTRREGGVVWGFDLDNHDSSTRDEEGCHHEDLVDPSGREGIDNALSGLVPALEATQAVAIEDLIQDSINSGELLVLYQVSGVDDLRNDDCVDVSVYRAEGAPLIGTDGVILDSQSFAASTLPPNDTVSGARIVDGVVEVEGMEILLSLQVLAFDIAYHTQQGSLRIALSEDGQEMSGFFGGGMPKDVLMGVAEEAGRAEDDLLIGLVDTMADLYPDENGQCQEASMAFEIEGTAAFFYGD